MAESDILQFAPFSSAVDAGFWHQFTKHKLDVLHLSEAPIPVTGNYVNSDPQGLPARLSVEFDSLDLNPSVPTGSFTTVGQLINTNTVEDFRNKDKAQLLRCCAGMVWSAITSGDAMDQPSLLNNFLCFTFADLKKYHYYYWFGFPAFIEPKTISFVEKPKSIGDAFTDVQVSSLVSAYENRLERIHGGYFTVVQNSDSFEFYPLRDYGELRKSCEKVFIGCADPSTMAENPGWPLRNLLTLVKFHWSEDTSHHKVLCLRIRTRSGVKDAKHSIIFEVDLGGPFPSAAMPACIGWEKNERGKLGPRLLNLSSSMDPTRLAESAVDLNLKLMRWRVAPDLNLDVIKNTRCLLLGAGTLGCTVARVLMGWGVQNITFVDIGKISYSNPVRQNLFTFDDCLNGGQHKATAAAEALKKIFPKMNSRGVVLSIPMPGHVVGESLVQSVTSDVAKLEQLVEEHDVIFLLTDSRESRWLPTLLGAAKSKLVLTAALGFDSYLVMRHGQRRPDQGEEEAVPLMAKSIPGTQIGCYFCNDVMAPGDSTRDRTLDQQCTVTRPGVSYMAAALVVELLVSILQHPDKSAACAGVSGTEDITEGVLGPVPHTIRGFLSQHQQLTPATVAFSQCSACSPKVVSTYKSEGIDFLLKVFNSPAYLEELTGLSKLHQDIDIDQIWALSDSEEESET